MFYYLLASKMPLLCICTVLALNHSFLAFLITFLALYLDCLNFILSSPLLNHVLYASFFVSNYNLNSFSDSLSQSGHLLFARLSDTSVVVIKAECIFSHLSSTVLSFGHLTIAFVYSNIALLQQLLTFTFHTILTFQ